MMPISAEKTVYLLREAYNNKPFVNKGFYDFSFVIRNAINGLSGLYKE